MQMWCRFSSSTVQKNDAVDASTTFGEQSSDDHSRLYGVGRYQVKMHGEAFLCHNFSFKVKFFSRFAFLCLRSFVDGGLGCADIWGHGGHCDIS